MKENNFIHTMETWRPDALHVFARLYSDSLFLAHERMCFRRDGRAAQWALDVRRALAHGDVLASVSEEASRLLATLGAQQVVTVGCAGGILLGGVLASMRTLQGGLLRDSRKAYGFRELVEGHLDRSQSIVLIDDILSSGHTALGAIKMLREDGYTVSAMIPLFHYTWRSGEQQLIEAGCAVHALSRLTYKLRPRTPVVWEAKNSPKVIWEKHPAYHHESII